MGRIADFIFARNKHVCPWWLCFTFDNVFRKILQDPVEIIQPYIKEGDKILDVGPGMGYFTIPLARLTGSKGQVIAADIQEKMLLALKKRAERAGVNERIILHLCSSDLLDVREKVDFILAFWMLHEVPDKHRFLNELFGALKENGTFLLVEPLMHVTKTGFAETVTLALKTGFTLGKRPRIFISRAALLVKLAENERREL
ncbi:MAG: hypothetical protein CVU54_01500 [Deltaproteobacteria bacterium HGW-Deltaproteobacteria-12]|jgi:ubiquinone/menaquinone biosynthesis C-methylase UbiE|nr:MAG: hypothetical protein CVU54_01500 [Deltaproteobacteria bacterium HGW-Deltaproteobacteria-12]